MPPRRDHSGEDAADIARGAAAIWRNRGVLAVVCALLGLNVGGGVGSYFSGKKTTVDSATVAQAVKAGMDPIRDTIREQRRDIRDVTKDVSRVTAQADKTEAKLDAHLLAYSWVRPTSTGRHREVRD